MLEIIDTEQFPLILLQVFDDADMAKQKIRKQLKGLLSFELEGFKIYGYTEWMMEDKDITLTGEI